jgi:hypothetical protein
LTPSCGGGNAAAGRSLEGNDIMKLRKLALATAFVAAAAGPTMAADILASDPKSVLDALNQLGYQGSLTTAANGKSSIEMKVDGSPTYVDFYNCDDNNTNCRSIMLVYGIDLTDGTTLEKANEWNTQTIHGFIYLDDKTDPWLEMTMPIYDGISSTLFENVMIIWRNRIGDMRKFFDL